MKVAVLIRHAKAQQAFELREVPLPEPQPGQVRIKVTCFGLNFADVMARKGLYQDAPPMPSILGYEVVGIVEKLGEDVDEKWLGERVVALTRFGGYAEYAISWVEATAKLPEEISDHAGTALATQYTTAYYISHVALKLFPHQTVLIHAAAGGVGLALMDMVQAAGAIPIGTVGSASKKDFLHRLGYKHISLSTQHQYVQSLSDWGMEKVDAVLDSMGGSYVHKGYRLLKPGGTIVCFGGATRSGRKWGISDLGFALAFGIYSPIQFLMQSKGMIGVNMLRIADHKPQLFSILLSEVIQHIVSKKWQTPIAQSFKSSELSIAHQQLEDRQTTGKLAVYWTK